MVINTKINIILCLMFLTISCRKEFSNVEEINGELFKIVRYSNDSLKSKVRITNGQPDGTEYEYYRSGNLKFGRDWYQGEIEGHQFLYYDDRDTIITADEQGSYLAIRSKLKSYKFKVDGIDVFDIEFDEGRMVKEQRGSFVMIVFPEINNQIVGDTLHLEIQLPLLHVAMNELTLLEQTRTNEYSPLASPVLNEDEMRAYLSIPMLVESGKRILAVAYEVEVGGAKFSDTTFLPSFKVIGE